MNQTNVSSEVLNLLTDSWGDLTPEAQKAARYVLENPNSVGVSTVREIAEFARVKPNTFVRLARQIGYEGYDEFREPFRAAIRDGLAEYPDRARWLQGIAVSGAMGQLFADQVGSAIKNIEDTFAGLDAAALEAAARTIWTARKVYVLGVGINNSNAQNFAHLASTGMRDFNVIPRPGSTASDDLAWADRRDVLIAITCHPYRTEVVDAVQIAREQGVSIIGISDSPASPIVLGSEHGFIVASDTPQFFPSSVSTVALMETLLSFVIAVASPEVPDRVENFHQRRHQLGLYHDEAD